MKNLNFKNMMAIILIGFLNQHCVKNGSDSNPPNATPAGGATQSQGLTGGSLGSSHPNQSPTPEAGKEFWSVRTRSFVTNGIGNSVDPDLNVPMDRLPYFTAATEDFSVQNLLSGQYDPTHYLKTISVVIKDGIGFEYNSVRYAHACVQTHIDVVDKAGNPVNISRLTKVQAYIQLMDISGAPITDREYLYLAHGNDCSKSPSYDESMNGMMLQNDAFSFVMNWKSLEPYLLNPDLGRANHAYLKVTLQIIPDNGDQGFKEGLAYSFPLLVKTY